MRSGTLKFCTGAALAASALFVAQNAAAVEFNGYMRSGAGINGEGGKQVCYRLTGAQADFRLGNECETYAELVLSQNVYEEGNTSAAFHSRVSYVDHSAAYNDYGGFGVGLPELWVEIDNPFGNGLTWWAGKRFYRYGIHINDFFYWNNSGTGAGISGVDLGFAKLDFALMLNSSAREVNVTPTVLDSNSAVKPILRLKGIQVNPGGKLQFAVQYSFNNEGANRFHKTTSSGENGLALLIQHTQTGFFMDGSTNRFIVQFGQGAAAGLDTVSNGAIDSDVSTIRVIDALVANITPDFSLSVVGLYQHTNNADESVSLPESWKSIGGRFVYYLTDNFRLNLEASTTWTEGGALERDFGVDDTARFSKITFAPAVTVGRGFFARPELRLFATYADWNGTAGTVGVLQGAPTDSPFSGTDGWTFGVQAEVWW